MSSPTPFIVDLTEANFAEVIGRSRQFPVLVDFWADWCAPCKQFAPVFEKLAKEFNGQVIFAKVNADAEPAVTQQFGVRGLPTLKLVVQGQLAGELVGAQPEAAVRQLLASFLAEPEPGASEIPDFHAEVLAAIGAGHLEDAMAVLRAQLNEAPEDHRSREILAETLIQEGRLSEAGDVLRPAPVVPELKRVRALLAFAQRAEGLPRLQALEAAVAASPESGNQFEYAIRLIAANRLEEGMEILLQVMCKDRQYGEDAARKALLEVFEMLGREDPVTLLYRKRMASFLL